MPPMYVKGGAWSNVEDEILKAAVSKYGLNQWARVASLLTKKSAKQAKARWNEWLNPNINKTGWTREEDEKLLGLVKLLANQWRTISSIMGRTASHCVERYQKLLDDVNNENNDNELGLSGPGIEAVAATGTSNDMNLNIESKPARPDEEDMDDEEREMLSEAKARLANTLGKKAKRKARERMVEESNRIALLQKRREMKAAGLNTSFQSKNKNKRKEFDYNADIPHEHLPQAGLYDVSEEANKNELHKVSFDKEIARDGMAMKEVEDKHKKDKKNKQLSEQSKKHKLGLEAAADLINEVEQTNLKKRKLELPAPTGSKDIVETEDSQLSKGNDGQSHDETDVDQRILNATKEIIAKQEIKSTLLIDDATHNNDRGLVSKKDTTTNLKAEKLAKSKLKKFIATIIKQSFASLPTPQTENGIILPSFDDNEEPVTLNLSVETPTIADHGERIRNLEILRQIDEEKAKLRRSQAVQRGLPIPDPKLLKVKSEGSEIEKLVDLELHKLIRSDYRKYVDTTFKAPLVEDLDDETIENTKKEIDTELSNSNGTKLVLDSDIEEYKLTETFEAAENAIAKLHEFHTKSETLQLQIIKKLDYETYKTTENTLVSEIQELFTDLYNVSVDLKLYQGLQSEEEIIIETRSKNLQEMVDDLVKTEHSLQDRIRALRQKN